MPSTPSGPAPARRRASTLRRLLGTLAAALLLPLLIVAGGARTEAVAVASAAEPTREYLIKAAFLYNFAKFTEWPKGAFAGASTSLQVCVLGEDPFGPALESIAGKPINGRIVVVRRVGSIGAARPCHMVFVSASEEARLTSILETLGARPILTVADMPNFARAGGIINLKTNDEDKLRFEINVRTARRAGLKLSSKLLNLAELTPN
ncbi:MAG: YfiR family protein [Kiloniellaceae bacterium]